MLYSNKVEHHPLTRELRIGDREKEKRGRVRRGDWYRVARCYQECNYYDTLTSLLNSTWLNPKPNPKLNPNQNRDPTKSAAQLAAIPSPVRTPRLAAAFAIMGTDSGEKAETSMHSSSECL